MTALVYRHLVCHKTNPKLQMGTKYIYFLLKLDFGCRSSALSVNVNTYLTGTRSKSRIQTLSVNRRVTVFVGR